MPYHGTPQPPQEEMREYHVRKDNTVQYRGIITACHAELTGAGRQTTVWLQETEGNVELYNKDTGETHLPACALYQKGKDRL